jgi:serine/threonine-protein kinase
MEEGHFKPGDKCDRYEIVRLIAAGGMGEVYEAVHCFTRRPVALKVLQLRHASKPDILERMRREAIFLSQIRHPNMVPVHDADITPEGIVWIAMELLEGRTLREVVSQTGALPLQVALYFATEVADGLQAAHELEVIHRDIKPENIFVTTDHHVKVLDLGAAKFYGHGVKTTDRMKTLGTPAYMSPEHIQGQKVDARADIYALGLVLYEMIAGHHAFAHTIADDMPSRQELGTLQLFGNPKPLTEVVPTCPAYVWEVVAKAVAKKREDRYASMTELAGALRATRRRVIAELGPFDGADDSGLPVASRPGARRDYAPPRSVPRGAVVPIETERRVVPAITASVGATPYVPTEMLSAPSTTAGGTQIHLEGPHVTAKGTQIQLEAPSPAPRAREAIAVTAKGTQRLDPGSLGTSTPDVSTRPVRPRPVVATQALPSPFAAPPGEATGVTPDVALARTAPATAAGAPRTGLRARVALGIGAAIGVAAAVAVSAARLATPAAADRDPGKRAAPAASASPAEPAPAPCARPLDAPPEPSTTASAVAPNAAASTSAAPTQASPASTGSAMPAVQPKRHAGGSAVGLPSSGL